MGAKVRFNSILEKLQEITAPSKAHFAHNVREPQANSPKTLKILYDWSISFCTIFIEKINIIYLIKMNDSEFKATNFDKP